MNANAAQSPALLGRGQLPRQDATNGTAGGLSERSSTGIEQPASNWQVDGSSPSVSTNTHSARLPALDSDGAAVLPAPRRTIRIAAWANALIAGLKHLSRYGVRGFTSTSPQTSADIFHTAPITAPGPMPAEPPQSALYSTLLRRGLMIHNRNRDKAERWAAAHMAMHNRIYSGADK